MIAVLAPIGAQDVPALVQLAEEFSPRVECGASGVALDASGVSRLFGGPDGLAREIARQAGERGLAVRVCVAATRTAAALLIGDGFAFSPGREAKKQTRPQFIPPGREAAALAPLPIAALAAIADLLGPALAKASAGAPARRRKGQGRNYRLAPGPDPGGALTRSPDHEITRSIDRLTRWGLRTLGDLARLPADELSARLGEAGLVLQRAARGEDERPLVPAVPAPVFLQSMRLDWPLDDLQPLAFVVSRLCESLEQALARADRGAIAVTTMLRLVNRTAHARTLTLPAPMRDARVMRTLVMLDLESHPPGAAVDEVVIDVDVAPGRILQTGLFEPALPAPETLSTLVARLGALVGETRIGAPAVVDTHRPGAFAMRSFAPHQATGLRPQAIGLAARELSRPSVVEAGSGLSPVAYGLSPEACGLWPSVIRRFRPPRDARVRDGARGPARVEAGDIRGEVVMAAGPWRASGGWWDAAAGPWDRDEWDVALDSGLACRLAQDRATGKWVIDGVLD